MRSFFLHKVIQRELFLLHDSLGTITSLFSEQNNKDGIKKYLFYVLKTHKNA